MCKTIVAFSRRDIVDHKYDLMQRIAEKDLSLMAFVAGITSNKHISFTTWEISALSPTGMPLTSEAISCMQVLAVEG